MPPLLLRTPSTVPSQLLRSHRELLPGLSRAPHVLDQPAAPSCCIVTWLLSHSRDPPLAPVLYSSNLWFQPLLTQFGLWWKGALLPCLCSNPAPLPPPSPTQQMAPKSGSPRTWSFLLVTTVYWGFLQNCRNPPRTLDWSRGGAQQSTRSQRFRTTQSGKLLEKPVAQCLEVNISRRSEERL